MQRTSYSDQKIIPFVQLNLKPYSRIDYFHKHLKLFCTVKSVRNQRHRQREYPTKPMNMTTHDIPL